MDSGVTNTKLDFQWCYINADTPAEKNKQASKQASRETQSKPRQEKAHDEKKYFQAYSFDTRQKTEEGPGEKI